MSFKQAVKTSIGALGALPLISTILHNRRVRSALSQVRGAGLLYDGWNRAHPFDRRYGTDTSGRFSAEEMRSRSQSAAAEHMRGYGGSQPSLVRAALNTLPRVGSCTFVDLGCGKGRPLLVATEFPFRDIVGIELSPELAQTARHNTQLVAALHPARARARVETGDASEFPLPAGDLVLFLYHPFSAPLMQKVVEQLERALRDESTRRCFVVLYNPVHGALFDASPAFTRRFARLLPYAPEELGYGPDARDAVVIWQAGQVPLLASPPAARIRITELGVRAELDE